jgi:hypothetical protein
MRVDMTALCLSLLGLFLFLRRPGAGGSSAAGVVFLASLFTKQSMIAAPAAAMLALLMNGQRREATAMAAVMGVLGGGLIGLLTIATGGEFLRHTVRYNANPFNLAQFFSFASSNLLGMNALAGLALAIPLTLLASRRPRDVGTDNALAGRRQVALTAALYLGTASLTSLSAGKLGAGPNYFLEWNIACCILIGLLLGPALGLLGGRSSRTATAMAIIAVIGFAGFTRLGTTVRQWRIVTGHDARLNQIASEAGPALDAIRATPGRVFSDDMILLMKAKRDVPWEPAITAALARTGDWDDRLAVDLITTGQFEAIIVRNLDEPLFFTRAIRAAIRDRYVDTGVLAGRYRLLERARPAPAGPRPVRPGA